jgi:cytochrome c biogenesis factor
MSSHREALKDVYVTVIQATPNEDGTFSATVTVVEIPAIGLLWLGMYLMSIGVVLRPLEGWKSRPKGGPPKEEEEATGTDDEGEGDEDHDEQDENDEEASE